LGKNYRLDEEERTSIMTLSAGVALSVFYLWKMCYLVLLASFFGFTLWPSPHMVQSQPSWLL